MATRRLYWGKPRQEIQRVRVARAEHRVDVTQAQRQLARAHLDFARSAKVKVPKAEKRFQRATAVAGGALHGYHNTRQTMPTYDDALHPRTPYGRFATKTAKARKRL